MSRATRQVIRAASKATRGNTTASHSFGGKSTTKKSGWGRLAGHDDNSAKNQPKRR